MFKFYTDGSCRGNGKDANSGGYGVVEILVGDNGEEKLFNCHAEQSENTTNNREEMKAILLVMDTYAHHMYEAWGTVPVVYSDSAYCVNTFNEWMHGWARNGWIKSDKKTPENLDLIQAYYKMYHDGYRIDLRKIKGHVGNKWNELADQLATGKITPEEALKIYG